MQIERFKDPQTDGEKILASLNHVLNGYWNFIRKGYKITGFSKEVDYVDVTKPGDEWRKRELGKSGRIIIDFLLEDK